MSANTSIETIILACPACSKKNRLTKERLADAPKCGACKAQLVAKQPIDLTISNYNAHFTSDMPLVVDFWAPWCGPCLQFAPFYEQVAPKFAGRAVFSKINTQNENVLGDRFAIRSIPTIAVFYKNQEIARQAGVMSPAQLEQWVEGVLQQL